MLARPYCGHKIALRVRRLLVAQNIVWLRVGNIHDRFKPSNLILRRILNADISVPYSLYSFILVARRCGNISDAETATL